MIVAIAAAVVVLKRGDHAAAPAPVAKPEKPALAPIIDKTVLATDVVKLQRGNVEPAVGGVRVKDDVLAGSLGLQPDDIITSVSGRHVDRDLDLYDAIFNISMMKGTAMYIEVTRDGQSTLLRWHLDGDLRQARYSTSGTPYPSLFGAGSAYVPPPPDPPDPMLDTIERIDDTHVKLPRKTAEHIFGNPMATMKGARVVPAIKNGQPDGVKLYAIRPSSVFAKLGLTNGDTIEQINGTAITTPDKALELYTKLQKADVITIDITRRGNPLRLTITITK